MAVAIDLTGKNALVTGGTRGIGRVVSRRLVEAGARVGAIYRSDGDAAHQTLEELSSISPLDHFAVKADIADEAQAMDAVSIAVSRFGGSLDILVLDAAAGGSGTIEGAAMDDWRRPFEVNVFGHVAVCREVYPAMRRGGSVVFISSGAGHDPIAGLSAYGASKAAVNQTAFVMAQEWGPRGIRVNVISPGHTAKEPVDMDNLTGSQKEVVENTALRRIGTADDVANAVLLFVSDLAGFVTGQYLRVNGGRI